MIESFNFTKASASVVIHPTKCVFVVQDDCRVILDTGDFRIIDTDLLTESRFKSDLAETLRISSRRPANLTERPVPPPTRGEDQATWQQELSTMLGVSSRDAGEFRSLGVTLRSFDSPEVSEFRPADGMSDRDPAEFRTLDSGSIGDVLEEAWISFQRLLSEY